MIPGLPNWITDLDARATHHVTRTGGVGLHWRIWGEGEPLVLLHGGSGSWLHWVRNIGPLADRFRVIVPDMPSFGDSDPFETTEMDAFAGQIADGLRQIEPGPVRIAGFSFGSVVGLGLMRLGITGPDYVMIGSPVMGRLHPVTDQLKKWRNLPEADRFAAHRNNIAVLMLARPESVTDESAAIQMAHAERSRGRYRGIFHGIDFAECLALRGGKLTVIYGDRDALVCRHLDERRTFVEALPGETEFVLLPGMGHWLPYEAADEVNRRLLAL